MSKYVVENVHGHTEIVVATDDDPRPHLTQYEERLAEIAALRKRVEELERDYTDKATAWDSCMKSRQDGIREGLEAAARWVDEMIQRHEMMSSVGAWPAKIRTLSPTTENSDEAE